MADQGGNRTRALRITLALLLITAVAAGLRLYHMPGASITLEEYACVLHLDAPTFGEFIARQRPHYPYGAPLVPCMQYAWARLFGTGIAGLRLFSMIASLLCIPLVYGFTRRLIGDSTRGTAAGLVAALCMALSHVQVFHGQEARMYAFFMLFALASAYAFLRMLEGGARWWWALNVLANAMLIWAHFFGALLVATQGVVLLARFGRHWRPWLAWGLTHAAPALPMAAWVLTIPRQPGELHGYYAPPAASQLFWDLFGDDLALRGSMGFAHRLKLTPDTPAWVRWHPAVDALFTALFVLAGCYVAVRAVRAWRRAEPALYGWLFTLLWLVLPLAVLALVSHTLAPVYSSRYTVHASVPLYVGLGGLVALLPGRAGLRGIAVSLLAACYAYQLVLGWAAPIRTQWKPLIDRIAESAGENDVVLVEGVFWLPLFELNNTRVNLPTAAAVERAALCDLAATCATATGAAAWVVLVDGAYRGSQDFDDCAARRGFQAQRWDYPGERPLVLYALRSPAGSPPPPVDVPDILDLPRLVSVIGNKPDHPALSAFGHVLRAQPDAFAAPHLRLGLDAARRGRAQLAETLLRHAAWWDPQFAVDLYLLQCRVADEETLEEARERLEGILVDGEESRAAYLGLAILTLHAGEHEKVPPLCRAAAGADEPLGDWVAWSAHAAMGEPPGAAQARVEGLAGDRSPRWRETYVPLW